MKRIGWQIWLGISLVVLSAVLYFVHFKFFHDLHHIFIYLVGDIAFVPIEVLLVTIIIHKFLTEREKRSRLKKLNMVIGAFFSEVGTGLLKDMSTADTHAEKVKNDLKVLKKWPDRRFGQVRKRLKNYEYEIDIQKADLQALKNFLKKKRGFLLALLENPNLLEHESFTDLLWSVFHLSEELCQRKSVTDLPGTDYEHLAGDIKRAYSRLIAGWIEYMKHLKDDYPYLYSLAIRTNPFDDEAQPVVV